MDWTLDLICFQLVGHWLATWPVSLPFSGPVHFTKWSSEGGNSRHFIHLIHSIMMFVSPLGPTDNDEFFSPEEKKSIENQNTLRSMCTPFRLFVVLFWGQFILPFSMNFYSFSTLSYTCFSKCSPFLWTMNPEMVANLVEYSFNVIKLAATF